MPFGRDKNRFANKSIRTLKDVVTTPNELIGFLKNKVDESQTIAKRIQLLHQLQEKRILKEREKQAVLQQNKPELIAFKAAIFALEEEKLNLIERFTTLNAVFNYADSDLQEFTELSHSAKEQVQTLRNQFEINKHDIQKNNNNIPRKRILYRLWQYSATLAVAPPADLVPFLSVLNIEALTKALQDEKALITKFVTELGLQELFVESPEVLPQDQQQILSALFTTPQDHNDESSITSELSRRIATPT